MDASSNDPARLPNAASRRTDTAVALAGAVVAGLSPNIGVAAFAGLASMKTLFWFALIPAEVLLFGLILYARFAGFERAFRRLWIGVLAGIALTIALDVVRYTGFRLEYLPADMPLVFGKQILGLPMMAEATGPAYLLGYGYHFLNGIGFGVVYSVFFGRSRWWLAVVYSVFFVEVGMMTLPPMAKMLGPFGVEQYGTVWNGMFLTTLLAHVSMGLALGGVVQAWGRFPGLLFPELKDARWNTQDGVRFDSFVLTAGGLCCGLSVVLLASASAGILGGLIRGGLGLVAGALVVFGIAILWGKRQMRTQN